MSEMREDRGPGPGGNDPYGYGRSSGGLVLTNNHVIEGSTKITATVVSTGKTYPATDRRTPPMAPNRLSPDPKLQKQ